MFSRSAKFILNKANFCGKVHTSGFLKSRRQSVIATNNFQKKSMALKIICRCICLKFDLGSVVKAPEVARVKGFVVGLEIPANNFRTNIARGKMFTPLCFSCKITPNYVYVDLKRSPSDVTVGQCKSDLGSMSKTSKLCQVLYK